MKHTDLESYINDRANQGLTKIEFVLEADPNVVNDFNVLKTKETYVYAAEGEADEAIDNFRIDPGFLGVEKKYKAGKMSKSGEEIKPETWSVIVKLAK